MVALTASNHEHLNELERKLLLLKRHSDNRPSRRYFELKLRELEAERYVFGMGAIAQNVNRVVRCSTEDRL